MVRYIDLDAKKQTLLSSLFGSNADKVAMIRLQNPWGEIEWNGPWSDTDSRWEEVTEAQKQELGMTVDEDGEFWMPWEEFVKYFTDISVCQLFNTGCSTASGVFNEYIFFDEWSTNGVKCGAPKDRSGGCQNFSATFCFNPQYRFDVYEPGSEMMIALTQKEIQNEAAKQREPYVTIGLHVMKVETNRRHRIHQAINPAINPVGTSDYASARSVYLHLTDIGPGRYILMPTTYAPREQAEYMLRIYSQHDCNPKLLLRDFPKTSPFMCTKLSSVTRLKIIEATIHSPPKDSNLFVSITSDKERVRTISQKSSTLVEWNEPFVFHRNDLRQKYSIEIIQEGPKRLQRIGKCFLTGLTDNDTRIQLLDIQSIDGEKHSNNLAKTRIGNLKVEISSFDDHMYL
uniref:Calpain catalytic domain-containing protein n=1 Tax=Panagrolaimus sp. PS1159 TaxID=55785 RepID=A0AC35G5F8_9BILA